MVLLSTAVLAAGWTRQAGREARLEGGLRVIADQVVLRLEAFVAAQRDVMHRLRAERQAAPQMSDEEFRRRALAIRDRYPGFHAFSWLDEQHVLRWSVPGRGNEPALGFDLDAHPMAAPALGRAEQSGAFVVSRPLELLQGGWGLLAFLRLKGTGVDGVLVGVFRAEPLLEAALGGTLTDEMAFAFEDRGVPVARLGLEAEKTVAYYTVERAVRVGDREWTLRVAPGQAHVANAIGSADGVPVMLGLLLSLGVGVLLAVGQRRQALLHESERRYRGIINEMNEGIWTLDADGRTEFVSQQMAAMLGYTPRQMTRRPIDDFVDESQRAVVRSKMGPQPFDRGTLFELEFTRADGSTMQTVVSAKPFLSDAGKFTGAQALITDVTERKRLEAQLLHSQKMEAVGRLAGGIAHDFNNLVTGIMGACHLLELELEGRPESLELVDDIHRCGERAADLTQQLLAFSRQQVLKPTILDPARVVEESTNILRRVIGEDIDLRIEIGPDLWSVSIDPTQLQQVLLNLVVNARDAMPSGGTISVRGCNLDAHESVEHGLAPGQYVALTVQDTGDGIPAHLLDQIFEPFFTTKAFGKGTGLGLATVLGIVEQSGGRVTVDSQDGQGSMFSVFLLRAEGEPEEKVHVRRRGVTNRGEETILLVEDEDAVRKLVQRVLQRAGYVVHAASRPNEALTWAGPPERQVDLLITDVVMPEMNGLVLVEELRRQRPDLPVIFISGYAEADRLPEALQHEVFIQKPFSVEVLTETARRALDRDQPPNEARGPSA